MSDCTGALWSEKSLSDVRSALGRVAALVGDLLVDLDGGRVTPNEALERLEAVSDYLGGAECAAEWDADPDCGGQS